MLTYYATLNAGNQFFDRLERQPAPLATSVRSTTSAWPLASREARAGWQPERAAGAQTDPLSPARHAAACASATPSVSRSLPRAPSAARHPLGSGALYGSPSSRWSGGAFVVYLLVLRAAADARIASWRSGRAGGDCLAGLESLTRRGATRRASRHRLSSGVVITLPAYRSR